MGAQREPGSNQEHERTRWAEGARSPEDRDSGLSLVAARERARAGVTEEPAAQRPADARTAELPEARRELFHALYREHFDFVYRNLRRLGVPEAQVDDALQDVYLVVLRRIDGFQEGTHARAWLFAIAMRVAGNFRRAQRRRGPTVVLPEDAPDLGRPDPYEQTARAHAGRLVHEFLDSLDDERRAVFVMAELEQMTAPEIATALSANVNTIYGRIRAARSEFERMVAQLHAQNGGDRG